MNDSQIDPQGDSRRDSPSQISSQHEPHAALFGELEAAGLVGFRDRLRKSSQHIMDPSKHGHLEHWQRTIGEVPRLRLKQTDLQSAVVSFSGECSPEERAALRASLMQFHPWRKGPFDLFGVHVDAEWRSDLKWSRVAPHLSLADKYVLDVGCGNGYYGWRMLGAGARCVVGLEPYPLYNAQHQAIQAIGPDIPNYVVPASDQCLEQDIEFFDVVFSMGVLYHAKDPLGHLQRLRQALRTGGTLVLETLIVEGDANTALIPDDRYAKMRNVWLLPSALMLERILTRMGFRQVEVADVTRTTVGEQRRTEWMTFESLADFLDEHDATRTIEGHPAPLRATLIAHR